MDVTPADERTGNDQAVERDERNSQTLMLEDGRQLGFAEWADADGDVTVVDFHGGPGCKTLAHRVELDHGSGHRLARERPRQLEALDLLREPREAGSTRGEKLRTGLMVRHCTLERGSEHRRRRTPGGSPPA